MDQALRLLTTGHKPLASVETPIRAFTKANVNQAGTPPKADTGFGKSYVAGYTKLWSGAS
jgi:ribose transport system substrate-binding protein